MVPKFLLWNYLNTHKDKIKSATILLHIIFREFIVLEHTVMECDKVIRCENEGSLLTIVNKISVIALSLSMHNINIASDF